MLKDHINADVLASIPEPDALAKISQHTHLQPDLAQVYLYIDS